MNGMLAIAAGLLIIGGLLGILTGLKQLETTGAASRMAAYRIRWRTVVPPH
jgi:hypothetical protein